MNSDAIEVAQKDYNYKGIKLSKKIVTDILSKRKFREYKE